MTQALYSAKTGLSVGQTQVDVIANNVANINTTAYKTANVTFQTLFSKTLSNGSAAGKNSGGTNPKQIGLGTQVGAITRNFENGSVQTTGRSEDLMISGNGYFVVEAANGTQYLTRDGNFSLDSSGNLTTAGGYKVVGTSDAFSTKTGTSTINIPTLLNAEVSSTDQAILQQKKVSELNNVSISKGTVTINVGSNTSVKTGDWTANGTGYDYTSGGVTTNYAKTTNSTAIKAVYGSYDSSVNYYTDGAGNYLQGTPTTGTSVSNTVRFKQPTVDYTINDSDLTGTVQDLVNVMNGEFKNDLTAEGITGAITVSVSNGNLTINNTTGAGLTTGDTQGSNFLAQTGFTTAFETATTNTDYTGTDLNKSVAIKGVVSYNNATKLNDYSVGEDGIITANYSDGSSLTVTMGSDNKTTWKYITSDKVEITGSGTAGSDVDTTNSSLNPSSMILELATVVNEGGLIATTDNLWTAGPNTGTEYYGIAGEHAFGSIKSGVLEGSNVDMTTELSNMIMAQRAIQMNSRVFSTASSILQTISMLGQ